MTVEEIIKKVRLLEIQSRKLSAQLFSGEYHAAFKGKGMLFKEVREYYPGDDPRFIDWNVSARFGHPYSKVFEEERERSVMLMLDISGSTDIGSQERTKRTLMTEIAATLAFSALSNHDKTGAILFSDQVEKYIPPKKGRQHLLYIIRTLLTHEQQSRGTNINEALKFVQKISRQRSILFLISDFASDMEDNIVQMSGARHDAIGIQLQDPADMQLPDAGLLLLEDPETGRSYWVDSSQKATSGFWKNLQQRRQTHTRQQLKKSGWGYVSCTTPGDYVKELQAFFIKRIAR